MSVAFGSFRSDPASGLPIYRQIADFIEGRIVAGELPGGSRLPATRELAGLLGLNRATISAAYRQLEESGHLSGQVGRGSFVANSVAASTPASSSSINFASTRPAADAFPLDSFRRLSKAVIDSDEAASLLQLGSPQGYGPLRRYLLERDRAEQLAGPDDDVLITNGCQQALDLLARAFVANPHAPDASVILVEDPVYHGLLRIFHRAGARLVAVPVTPFGIDLDKAEELVERLHPRLLIVTPEFQNPTGWTIPLAQRRRLVDLAHRHGVTVVENGIYSQLRYLGEALPSLKQLDPSGRGILLRSYSKVLFPGLRVGWVTAPRDVIRRLSEEKQIADLHSDQLAQAIFLRFAQSGELEHHIRRTCETGRDRLRATFRACEQSWPGGTRWSRPEGGMSLWVELPSMLTAAALQRRVGRDTVEFLPGTTCSDSGNHTTSLRLSFGGLAPAVIERGIGILGAAASAELAATRDSLQFEPEVAVV